MIINHGTAYTVYFWLTISYGGSVLTWSDQQVTCAGGPIPGETGKQQSGKYLKKKSMHIKTGLSNYLLRLCLVKGRAALLSTPILRAQCNTSQEIIQRLLFKAKRCDDTNLMYSLHLHLLQDLKKQKARINVLLLLEILPTIGLFSPQKLWLVRAKDALLSPYRLRAQCKSSGEKDS